jgi:hypothetical protein
VIIATTYEGRGPGVGGLPVWTKTIVATYTRADMLNIETGMVPADRLKLTVLPGRRELVALRTDGQPLTLVSFTPTDYDYGIVEGVLIGPARMLWKTPVQPSGTYSGYAIFAVSLTIQQTKANDW